MLFTLNIDAICRLYLSYLALLSHSNEKLYHIVYQKSAQIFALCSRQLYVKIHIHMTKLISQQYKVWTVDWSI